jgi:hypothetical protein
MLITRVTEQTQSHARESRKKCVKYFHPADERRSFKLETIYPQQVAGLKRQDPRASASGSIGNFD